MAANTVLYGFMNLKDAFAAKVEDVGIGVVNTAIDETLAEHNRQLTALTALFAESTTEYKVRAKTPVAARLQPLDENGRARPIKAAGYYDVAFPILDAGSAWGQTYKASKKATVEDANNVMATMLAADRRWLRDHILAALYSNANWTFADPEHGDLVVKGLAATGTDTERAARQATRTPTTRAAQARTPITPIWRDSPELARSTAWATSACSYFCSSCMVPI